MGALEAFGPETGSPRCGAEQPTLSHFQAGASKGGEARGFEGARFADADPQRREFPKLFRFLFSDPKRANPVPR